MKGFNLFNRQIGAIRSFASSARSGQAQVSFRGIVGTDPIFRQGPKVPYVNFPVMVSNGKGKLPNWFNCTYFNENLHDIMSIKPEHLKKGTHVYVTGTLKDYRYLRDDGSYGHSLQVVANRVPMLLQSISKSPDEEIGEITEEDFAEAKEHEEK